jgi:hypothetical protein
MRSNDARLLLFLVCANWSAMAHADGPATSRSLGGLSDRLQQVAREAMQRTDLVIEHIEWSARGTGSKDRSSHPESTVLESAELRVTVRNAGTTRWASEGRVGAVVLLGRPEELDATPRGTTGRAGADRVRADREPRLHQLARAPSGPFRGEFRLPGSLAPGERREVSVPLGYLSGGRLVDRTLVMAVDKYYTARVDLDVAGDDVPTNNGADLIFRIDRRGNALEPVVRSRSTSAAERGTIEIVAPKR